MNTHPSRRELFKMLGTGIVAASLPPLFIPNGLLGLNEQFESGQPGGRVSLLEGSKVLASKSCEFHFDVIGDTVKVFPKNATWFGHQLIDRAFRADSILCWVPIWDTVLVRKFLIVSPWHCCLNPDDSLTINRL